MTQEKLDGWLVDHSKLPTPTKTDYCKESDKNIIEYQEVEHVKMLGEKDTEFVKTTTVEEFERKDRQKYIDSFDNEVGILNIMKKVAAPGDFSLFNQIKRVSLPGTDKDALGRPVEDIADYTDYMGTDRADALNAYKKGRAQFDSLPDSLKGKKSFAEVAKMSDSEINSYIQSTVDTYKKQIAALKVASQEGGKE